MIRIASTLSVAALLGACETVDPYKNFVLDDADYMEAIYLNDGAGGDPVIMERIEPVAS